MINLKYTIEGGNFTNAGFASSQVKKTLKQLNVSTKLIKNVVVALYEAEVNIVAHANKGEIDVSISPEEVKMILTDQGKGIKDIDQAMTVGYSTASQKVRAMGFGAGMGLPNIKKNVDLLTIESNVGIGTTLTMIKKLI
ncbi:MAG: ATP-binding protein [Prolixibacteraceae bacterium]|jgi:serine/threonine-protein kinase RsbT|nr:ATP-binding protein [Prolixibacteraceae bacterium]